MGLFSDKSSNPIFGERVFSKEQTFGATNQMTINGTVNKAIIMAVLVFIAAAYTWGLNAEGGNAMVFTAIGGIAGFILAMITIFKKTAAPYTAPLYALAQGLFLGGITYVVESLYPGIAMQAIGLTMATLFSMLFVYKAGLIKVTDKFKRIMIIAIGAIAVFYLLSFILSFFGMSLIQGGGLMGIGISVVIIAVAALSLLLDFDSIEKGVQYGSPKYMEWFGAFGLMVTLIWLYIEFLRLLSALRRE